MTADYYMHNIFCYDQNLTPIFRHVQSHWKNQTRLPKVIWEQASNSLLVTVGRPTFAPKITPSHGPIPKPNYLPHPWTHLTLPSQTTSISNQPFCHNALDRRTHRPTYGWADVQCPVMYLRSTVGKINNLIILTAMITSLII